MTTYPTTPLYKCMYELGTKEPYQWDVDQFMVDWLWLSLALHSENHLDDVAIHYQGHILCIRESANGI